MTAPLRRVVIVSPYFPPSTLAGVHRARHLAQHLPAFGWDPVIVRVDERCYEEPGDPPLAALVRGDLKQVRVSAWPARITRRLGFGDLGLRAYAALGRGAVAAARDHGAELVMLTGSPFYPLLLAKQIKRRTGLPVLLDFQDPWVVAGGPRRRPLTRSWASHRLARLFEPIAVRHADYVTSVSDRQNEELADRHPALDRSRVAGIPIGGDPADFDALRASPPVMTHPLDSDAINFSYVGTLLPRAGPLLETVLNALRRVRERQPQLAARMRFNFVGTSNQRGHLGEGPVTAIARRLGVGDLVRETAARVGFVEALALLAGSDVLLMIGSDEPHYTASKIYPNLMAGRPYLSLFHGASSAHAILTAAAGGESFAFTDAAALATLEQPIADAMARLATMPQHYRPANPSTYAAYTAHAVAARYAAIFDSMTHAH